MFQFFNLQRNKQIYNRCICITLLLLLKFNFSTHKFKLPMFSFYHLAKLKKKKNFIIKLRSYNQELSATQHDQDPTLSNATVTTVKNITQTDISLHVEGEK